MQQLRPPRFFRRLSVSIFWLFLISTVASASAQSGQALIEDWRNADYGFTARMMATDLSDDIFIVGDTAAGDYLVIKKFSAAGSVLWQTTYDPVERLRGAWIAVDGGGNPVVLASMIAGSNATPAGWLTLKYSADGTLLWENGLPGPFRDARRVAIDGNDNIYVAGRMWLTNPSANTTHDAVLVKYSPAGATLWTAVFDNNSAVDEPYSLVISPDDSHIGIAGTSGNLFMALMYDPDGNRLWANADDTIYAANDLAFGPGNASFFATGTYFPQAPNPYQMAVVKFDSAGNRSWVKSYDAGDRTLRVAVDAGGSILATGIDTAGYIDWMTIKTDPDGNLLWARRYDGGRNNDETPNMLVLDDAGAVYVTGKGGPNPSAGTLSNVKGVVVKYGANGTPQWASWDDYAGGKALGLGTGSTLSTLGWGYLVAAHYTQTGLPDQLPATPTDLSGFASNTGSGYEVSLSFSDQADNEFWVEAERCAGSGCTDFATVAQSLGENATGLTDADVVAGQIYTYRVRARGFMGVSDPSNTVEVDVPSLGSPAAPSDLTAAMSGINVLLTWQDNAINETQFHVERCQGDGCTDFAWLDARGANITTLTDYSVLAGQRYSYRVRAWNSAGYSPYSNIATIATLGGICPDFNHSGLVDVADLSAIAGFWGQPAPVGYDLDGDGLVTIADIQLVAALWGTSCV